MCIIVSAVSLHDMFGPGPLIDLFSNFLIDMLTDIQSVVILIDFLIEGGIILIA